MRRIWNKTIAWTRTIHIYLTMFAFLLMMFFAVTGVLLVHEDLLPGETTHEVSGQLAPDLLAGPDRLMVVEYLRSELGAQGAVSTFDVDDATLHIEMRGPGRSSEAEIDRATGAVRLAISYRGPLVRLNDLHRGKDAGVAWMIILDASAILLFLGSLTGIMMWVALPRRRKWGLVALAGSLLVCGGAYLLFVP